MRIQHLMALVVLSLATVPGARAAATTTTWTGADPSGYWSAPANWSPAGVPTNGNDLVFPGGLPPGDMVSTNDLTNRIFRSISLAGGHTKGADQGSSFVVRANGNVISGLQTESGWFSRNSGVGNVNAEPGDTVFVPEEMNKTTFIQTAKDWTLLLYQLGIGIAGIKSAIK